MFKVMWREYYLKTESGWEKHKVFACDDPIESDRIEWAIKNDPEHYKAGDAAFELCI